MLTKKQLYDQAKLKGLKKISKLNKKQLEDALVLHYTIDWFNDIAGNQISGNQLICTECDLQNQIDLDCSNLETVPNSVV